MRQSCSHSEHYVNRAKPARLIFWILIGIKAPYRPAFVDLRNVLRDDCDVTRFPHCGIFSLFWVLLVLCVKLFDLNFKGFLWAVWAHTQTACTIFKILVNCGVFSLFWALLVLCIKLSNLDFKGFLWAVWAHIQTTSRIFKIIANCGVFSLVWAFLVLCVNY